MSEKRHKRGTAVIWTQRGEKPGSAKMVMGVVQAYEDPDHVTIEVVDPDDHETQLVKVPARHVRPL